MPGALFEKVLHTRDHEPPHFHAVYGEYPWGTQRELGESPGPRATRYDSTAAISTRTARITSVEPLQGFLLKLSFEDGTEREVDLEDELWGPIFEPLRTNRDLFRQVQVDRELGTIVWPNGADMDPDVLHGDFEATESTGTAEASQLSP